MIFLDTNILVPILREKPEGNHYLEVIKNLSVAITTINAFELFFGAQISRERSKNLQAVQRLVQFFPAYPFSLKASFIASKIHQKLRDKGENIDLNDAYIAGIVLEYGGELFTENRDHFKRVQGLKLFIPPL
ncbi:MAG: VapC toxin protein [Promethearchaeota archaeon CR_4]|nr:MAG: VapC toxin protein [Candidatus Lokiarchaeota archaeon CR_4]